MLKFIDIYNILIFQFIAGFEKQKNYTFETTTKFLTPEISQSQPVGIGLPEIFLHLIWNTEGKIFWLD